MRILLLSLCLCTFSEFGSGGQPINCYKLFEYLKHAEFESVEIDYYQASFSVSFPRKAEHKRKKLWTYTVYHDRQEQRMVMTYLSYKAIVSYNEKMHANNFSLYINEKLIEHYKLDYKYNVAGEILKIDNGKGHSWNFLYENGFLKKIDIHKNPEEPVYTRLIPYSVTFLWQLINVPGLEGYSSEGYMSEIYFFYNNNKLDSLAIYNTQYKEMNGLKIIRNKNEVIVKGHNQCEVHYIKDKQGRPKEDQFYCSGYRRNRTYDKKGRIKRIFGTRHVSDKEFVFRYKDKIN